MKKLLFLLLTATCISVQAQQVEIRGHVLTISKKRLDDNSVVKVEYPMRTNISLNDERLLIKTIERTYRYDLFDKDTVSIKGELMVSYMTEVRKSLRLVAIRQVPHCPDQIKLAIFPFGQESEYYTEYLFRISKPKK